MTGGGSLGNASNGMAPGMARDRVDDPAPCSDRRAAVGTRRKSVRQEGVVRAQLEGTFANTFFTRATQEAQVIPSMAKDQSLKRSGEVVTMGITVRDRARRDLASVQTVSRLPQ